MYEIIKFDDDKGTFLGFGSPGWVCASKFEDISRTKPKPFTCPVCRALVKVERLDDGESTFDVDKFTGELIETSGWSNVRTIIFCSKDVDHELEGIEAYILDKI